MTDSGSGIVGDRVMKRDALGRVHSNAEQRRVVLEQFERSGLSGPQFARVAGIAYQTFATWRQKKKRQTGAGGRQLVEPMAAPRLVEAVLAAPIAAMEPAPCSSAPAAAEALEVHLPCGARMLIATAQQATLAAQFIQALARSC